MLFNHSAQGLHFSPGSRHSTALWTPLNCSLCTWCLLGYNLNGASAAVPRGGPAYLPPSLHLTPSPYLHWTYSCRGQWLHKSNGHFPIFILFDLPGASDIVDHSFLFKTLFFFSQTAYFLGFFLLSLFLFYLTIKCGSSTGSCPKSPFLVTFLHAVGDLLLCFSYHLYIQDSHVYISNLFSTNIWLSHRHLVLKWSKLNPLPCFTQTCSLSSYCVKYTS